MAYHFCTFIFRCYPIVLRVYVCVFYVGLVSFMRNTNVFCEKGNNETIGVPYHINEWNQHTIFIDFTFHVLTAICWHIFFRQLHTISNWLFSHTISIQSHSLSDTKHELFSIFHYFCFDTQTTTFNSFTIWFIYAFRKLYTRSHTMKREQYHHHHVSFITKNLEKRKHLTMCWCPY